MSPNLQPGSTDDEPSFYIISNTFNCNKTLAYCLPEKIDSVVEQLTNQHDLVQRHFHCDMGNPIKYRQAPYNEEKRIHLCIREGLLTDPRMKKELDDSGGYIFD